MNKKPFLRSISLMLVLGMMLVCSAYAAPSNFSLNANSGIGMGNSKFGRAQRYVINRGIMKGDGHGNYFMSNSIKRGDMALMTVRAFKLSAAINGNFADVLSNAYYYEAIAMMKNLGVAKGDGRNFNPEKYVTIGEAILLIQRSINVANSNVTFASGVNLYNLYSTAALSNYATREDVADMLYYILTGDTSFNGTALGTITYSTDSDTKLTFDADDFTEAFDDATGDDLSYVTFTLPSSSYGTLYYGYTSSSSYTSKVSSSTKYYADSSPYLSKVSFVPKSSYSGTVSISYTAYDDSGNSYSGTVEIAVSESSASIDTIYYSTASDEELTFDADDFTEAFDDATGDDLSYVTFTLPSSSYGTLYYGYTSSSSYTSKVSSSTKYYPSSSPYLYKVSFVPKSSYSGTVSISYTAYDDNGDSCSGTVEITVSEGDASIDTIYYSTASDEELAFDADDFTEAFDDATGDDLYYVKFTLPSSSYGTLYYGYTSSSSYTSKVSSSTKYYADSSLYLSKVSFVPKSSYSGTVSISYTAYDDNGNSYSGIVRVTVADSGSTLGTITYSTDSDTKVTFDESDFADAFYDATGDDLSYVKFTLPSSSYGTLYYGYTSSSSYTSKVSSSTKYYPSSSPYLYKVSFVPKSGYGGTVSISYTAYDDNGNSYSGIVRVSVTDSGSDTLGTIYYSTDSDTKVTFDKSDFADAFYNKTGDDLYYVKFTLPSSSYGTLYYGYTSSSSYTSKVSSSTKYYPSSSPYLYKVSFVPKSGYGGTVSISYTAYDDNGNSCSGIVRVTVADSGSDTLGTITYSTDSDTKVTFDKSDFADAFYNKTGYDLYYVKFALPSYSYGTLYYGYTSPSSYTSKVSSSTKYYLNSSPYLYEVSFLPYSGYTGTVSISYVAYGDNGNSYFGIVRITVN